MERWGSSRTITRRRLLYLTGLAVTGVLAAACSGNDSLPGQTPQVPTAEQTPGAVRPATGVAPATAPATQAMGGQQTPATTSASYKEVPQLADLVRQGKLPPVDQRLPKEPMVIRPIDRIGVHGGQWRTGILGPADTAWLSRTIGYEGLVRWDPEWKEVVPDLAKKFEVSPDGKEFTFSLREGTKWSDGEPFTADDLVFWYEDVVLSPELTTVKPGWFTTAGKLGKLVKVDQYTVTMLFEYPNGLLLKRLCMLGQGMFFPQAKYAKQFHVKYNKAGVEKLVAEQRLDGWAALYQRMVGTTPGIGSAQWYNPELPSLLGWVLTSALGKGSRLVAKRNPYYWKVDPEGKQLPYIDEVVYETVETVDPLVLKALNGEIDMMDRHIATPANKPVFADNKARGNYDFFTTIPDAMNTCCVLFNFNHKDPALREIIHNVKFRIGLSHAINRQEIIDVVFIGQGEPWQSAPLKQSPYYHERLATQYLEYDVAKANRSLDEAGLARKGPDGLRLRPDGQPLTLTFEVTASGQTLLDSLELIAKYWKAVGVAIDVKPVDRALRTARVTAWEHDATVDGGPGGIDAVLGPYWYFPFASFNGFATAWAAWWESEGKKGEEPIPPAKRQQELYDQIKITADEGKQQELMRQILDIAAEQFWVMGISTVAEGYGIVKNDFKNVPKQMYSSGQEYVNPGATMPEQYYFAR